MPLSQDLRGKFIIMEDSTGESACNVVDCVVCTNYRSIIISALRGEQRKEKGEG